MKKTSNSISNRRKFLSLGLLGGAGLLSQKATAMLPLEPEEEKVLHADSRWKISECSKRVLGKGERSQERRPTRISSIGRPQKIKLINEPWKHTIKRN